MEEKQNKSRRSFLLNGLKFGASAVVGGVVLSKLTTDVNAETNTAKGSKIKMMTTDGKLVEVDSSVVDEVKSELSYDEKYNVREGFPNRKFVMVVDLAKCKNALKCQVSCNKNHYITGENAWMKVYKMQESKDTAPYWMPVACQHCDQPACVTVCPVDATFKRRDGIVLIDNERCIGCRFCMAACPYSARVFNWDQPNQGDIALTMEANNQVYTPDYAGMPSVKGTVDKCDFCPHNTVEGELPHCVSACPNGVFYFGDKYEDTVTNGDETLRLSKLLEDKSGYRFMEGLGTEPSVYYLPPTDRLVKFEDGLKDFKEFESVEHTD